MSVPELLDTLTARRNPGFHGAYEGFLWKLDEHGFAAAGHVAHGLRWARARFSQLGDVDLVHRIGMRIAHAALRELDDPGVAAELLSLLRHWAVNNRSPLGQLPNKEQREASILEAIGERGPNPSRHIDFVWLSVKPNSRVKPADAAAFREQVLALVRDCDRRWPIERFWRTGSSAHWCGTEPLRGPRTASQCGDALAEGQTGHPTAIGFCFQSGAVLLTAIRC